MHVRTDYVMISSTSRNMPFQKTVSAVNPSSTRAASDLTKRYVAVEEKSILGFDVLLRGLW